MKAEDLMVGNFVFREKLLVYKRDKEKYNLISVRPNDITACSLSPNKFKPILLTEENIVELLGFKRSLVLRFLYLKNEMNIDWYERTITINGDDIKLPKYVHKLQQLIKSLEE